MMGRQDDQQPLYCFVDLDERVPLHHPLRRVRNLIDFSFARAEVAAFYGHNGNESLDPEVILKLLFLLFFDDIPSERELMRQVGYRLDYLWFLGMSLNEPVPDHSVLSKARARWGDVVFEKLFVQTVRQCVEAGLVDGGKVHVDASMVDADASKNSMLKGPPQMIAALKALYVEQEAKLEQVRDGRRRRPARVTSHREDPSTGAQPAEPEACGTYRIGPQTLGREASPASISESASAAGEVQRRPPAEAELAARINDGMVSTTDPDAAIARHAPNCKSGPRPRYMSHRAVDDRAGVITAVASTPGDCNEGTLLVPLLEQHECNTQCDVEVTVADSKYGTIDNYIQCEQRGIVPHMADLNDKHAGSGRRAGIFSDSDFAYDPAADTYRCPAGQTLRPARHHAKRHAIDYTPATGVCAACPLRQQCTRSKTGRSIKRHDQQPLIERARQRSRSPAARRDRRRRQHLMERSFADASDNHGLKRSRWRRLWRQRIQDHLIAAAQNVRILAGLCRGPRRATKAASRAPSATCAETRTDSGHFLADPAALPAPVRLPSQLRFGQHAVKE